MNQKQLFSLWAALFALCAALGFLPEPTGLLRWGLTLLSVFSFAPPAALVYRAKQTGDGHTLKLMRNLAGLSLGLTLLLLVLSFLTALGSPVLGDFLFVLLTIVSSPMVCSGYWVLSLFLWACLLMACVQKRKP